MLLTFSVLHMDRDWVGDGERKVKVVRRVEDM